jgi:hypothetical protein
MKRLQRRIRGYVRRGARFGEAREAGWWRDGGYERSTLLVEYRLEGME